MKKHRKQPTPKRAERIARVLELRQTGTTYRDIAAIVGISTAQAHKDAKDGLAFTLTEPAEHLRTLELARLDRLQRAYWDTALAGDYKAADRVLRIIETRFKLLGLDKLPNTNTTEETYGMLQALLDSATT